MRNRHNDCAYLGYLGNATPKGKVIFALSKVGKAVAGVFTINFANVNTALHW